MPGPLDGFRIVECSELYSAPIAVMLLAPMGAGAARFRGWRSVDRAQLGCRRGGHGRGLLSGRTLAVFATARPATTATTAA